MNARFLGLHVRRGAIAVWTAVLLTALMGMVAFALDVGWIVMARTQLQAAADSSALAGGTELLPGLGLHATKSSAEVAAAASEVAVDFAARNRNAELASTYVDAERDIRFGKAKFESAEDGGCGCWTTEPGSSPYNYVEVTTLRNQGGAEGGDQPVPLFFARIFNVDESSLEAMARAAILPASGFRVIPGSGDTAPVLPFAMSEEAWRKYLRAQDHYDSNPTVFTDGSYQTVPDPSGTEDDPLLFGVEYEGQFYQEFFDSFTRTDGVVSGPGSADGRLEFDVYPKIYNAGSYGTVDFGSTDNSTSDIKRQIEEGLDEDDLSYYENGSLEIEGEEPLLAETDTGISAGMQSSLESIIGECRAIALFESYDDGTGNNQIYSLVRFEAAAVVEVKLTGSVSSKTLKMQPCQLVDESVIPDYDGEIGDDTTIFTPLILIQ